MKNSRFYWLIEQPRDAQGKRMWTVERIALAIYCGAAGAGLALVAGVRSVAEVDATSALQ